MGPCILVNIFCFAMSGGQVVNSSHDLHDFWGDVGRSKAIFGDVFEAVGLETERRLAVKVTELEKMRLQARPSPMPYGPA